LIGYASRTGTSRNLQALRENGWRLMVSARGVLRHEGFPYALDNGAWTAYRRNEAFDESAFRRALDLMGADADFVVAPDIVTGGIESLRFSEKWIRELQDRCQLTLIAVQDGMTPEDVEPMLSDDLGLFVGGSTDWKIHTLPRWGRVKASTGCYLHVGRVNTRRRIRLCGLAGADSFDGSGVSRFATEVGYLSAEVRQQCLILV